jgi:hypothetical protein
MLIVTVAVAVHGCPVLGPHTALSVRMTSAFTFTATL